MTDPTPAGCRTTRRCPIADDPCGPGGPRPYCWETGEAATPGEDVYRAAAEKSLDAEHPVGLYEDTLRIAVSARAGVPWFRAAVDAAYAARQPEIDRLNARIAALEFEVEGRKAQREVAYAAGREAERDHLRDWIKSWLDDIAADPDITTGEAIWREDGSVQALRDVLAHIDQEGDHA